MVSIWGCVKGGSANTPKRSDKARWVSEMPSEGGGGGVAWHLFPLSLGGGK